MSTKTYQFKGRSFPACIMRTVAAISTGKPIKEVSTILNISEHTVQGYLRTACKMLDVRKRCELMAITLTSGFDNMGNYLGEYMLIPSPDREGKDKDKE